MLTHLSSTSEVGGSNLDLMWKSWQLLTNGQQFIVQNLEQLYVLVPLLTKLPVVI